MSQLQDAVISFQQFEGKWNSGDFAITPIFLGVDISGSHFLVQEYQYDDNGNRTRAVFNKSYAVADLNSLQTKSTTRPSLYDTGEQNYYVLFSDDFESPTLKWMQSDSAEETGGSHGVTLLSNHCSRSGNQCLMLSTPDSGFQDAIKVYNIPKINNRQPRVSLEGYWCYDATANLFGLSIETYVGTQQYEYRVEYRVGPQSWTQRSGVLDNVNTVLFSQTIPSITQGLTGQPLIRWTDRNEWNYFKLIVDLNNKTKPPVGYFYSNDVGPVPLPLVHNAGTTGTAAYDSTYTRFEIHTGNTGGSSASYFYLDDVEARVY